jgi:transposase-like protein
MRKPKIMDERRCPKCGKAENQVNAGKNKSGTQRCRCKECGKYYTLEPKRRAYSEEIRKNAIKIYYSGVSGRGVGKILNMSKANVYNWIKTLKKTKQIVDK